VLVQELVFSCFLKGAHETKLMYFVIVIQFEIIVGTYTRDLQKYVDFFSLECNISHTAITNTLL